MQEEQEMLPYRDVVEFLIESGTPQFSADRSATSEITPKHLLVGELGIRLVDQCLEEKRHQFEVLYRHHPSRGFHEVPEVMPRDADRALNNFYNLVSVRVLLGQFRAMEALLHDRKTDQCRRRVLHRGQVIPHYFGGERLLEWIVTHEIDVDSSGLFKGTRFFEPAVRREFFLAQILDKGPAVIVVDPARGIQSVEEVIRPNQKKREGLPLLV